MMITIRLVNIEFPQKVRIQQSYVRVCMQELKSAS